MRPRAAENPVPENPTLTPRTIATVIRSPLPFLSRAVKDDRTAPPQRCALIPARLRPRRRAVAARGTRGAGDDLFALFVELGAGARPQRHGLADASPGLGGRRARSLPIAACRRRFRSGPGFVPRPAERCGDFGLLRL